MPQLVRPPGSFGWLTLPPSCAKTRGIARAKPLAVILIPRENTAKLFSEALGGGMVVLRTILAVTAALALSGCGLSDHFSFMPSVLKYDAPPQPAVGYPDVPAL